MKQNQELEKTKTKDLEINDLRLIEYFLRMDDWFNLNINLSFHCPLVTNGWTKKCDALSAFRMLFEQIELSMHFEPSDFVVRHRIKVNIVSLIRVIGLDSTNVCIIVSTTIKDMQKGSWLVLLQIFIYFVTFHIFTSTKPKIFYDWWVGDSKFSVMLRSY